MGPGLAKSKPRADSTKTSSSINSFLLMFFYSSSVNKFIILTKLGEIGCSSFAAINIEIVAKAQTELLGKFQCPVCCKYLSKMDTATKSVSILYSFLTCKSKIF